MSREGQGLLTGAVAGMFSKAQAEDSFIAIQEVRIPTDEDGNYLPFVDVKMPSGWYRIQVSAAPAVIQEEP